MSTTVRHAVPGVGTVALVDAPDRHVRAVVAALGPPAGPPGELDDLTVRFVERLPTGPGLTRLGDAAAYDDERFYLVGDDGALAAVDLTRAGEPLEIVCERRLPRVPLVLPLLAVRLAATDRVLLHAASFRYRGRGVLVAGWQGGGKSETLLPFMAHGAEHLADEWTAVERAGTMVGVRSHVQVWDWQLRQLPGLRPYLPLRARAQMRVASMALDAAGARRLGPLGRVLNLLRPGLKHNARRSVAPDALFGDRAGHGATTIDVALLAVVADRPQTTIRAVAAGDIAARMPASLVHERRELLGAYAMHRFAFPDRRSAILEAGFEPERSVLEAALSNAETYVVEHPKPLALEALFTAAEPVCAPRRMG
ncbi:MAG: hypothetical protein JWN32_3995 [Solirubrobacterales bacterium]|nr:hypothetical protein [Solirubrobacterales bacterium]